MTTKTSRESFGKWAKKEGYALDKSISGSYASIITEHAWRGWKEAMTHQFER